MAKANTGGPVLLPAQSLHKLVVCFLQDLNKILEVDLFGLCLLKHMIYVVQTDTILFKLSNRSSFFGCSLIETWTMDV